MERIKAIISGNTANRKNHNGYEIAKWPTIETGQHVEIESHDHWLYTATVETAAPDSLTFTAISREAMPMPPVNGQWYTVFTTVGDAWRVAGATKGAIVRINGKPYKVTDVRRNILTDDLKLTEVSEEVWAKRPGRVALPEGQQEHAVGRVFEIGGEFLLVDKVERQLIRSAGLSGYNYYGVGKFVDAAKAAKAKAKWEKAEAERRAAAEAELRRMDRAGF